MGYRAATEVSPMNISQKLREERIDVTSPLTGIFFMANTIKRPLPSKANDPITHESIHSSVLQQASVSPVLSGILALHPKIVPPLLPFEEEMKAKWGYDPSSPSALAYKKLKDQQKRISSPVVQAPPAVQAKPAEKPDKGRFFRALSLRIPLSRNAKV